MSTKALYILFSSFVPFVSFVVNRFFRQYSVQTSAKVANLSDGYQLKACRYDEMLIPGSYSELLCLPSVGINKA